MKAIVTLGASAFAGTKAFAHGGQHLHPHGAELYPVLIVLAILGVAAIRALTR